MKHLFLLSILFFYSCKTTSFYIVRHAEKAAPNATMSGDVPLSDAGRQRAIDLRERLQYAHITQIYSTNTTRTRSTAAPMADFYHLPILIYDTNADSTFTDSLRHTKRNTLIIGHSNTVDDLVNKLLGRTVLINDLPDNAYNNLYIITKRGKQFYFNASVYGAANP